MAKEKRLDLIDRQALGIGRCNPDAFPLQNRGYVAGWNGVISLLEQAPSVDAVEVVRCKACDQHAETKVENVVYCKKFNRFMNADGFCFYGERREGE